ncbi:DMT family transporter [Vannielia litorea]|uniref:Guanidinium exporter n=1 Tax=Vannielia litorea TaxID=1217970 RepID=A0A1N6EI85_9RHOB|nr:multidrug efflux SMR transporter [Vannielia litorea]SIN82657.1 quaternary ammonium compound-resistance protein SugE [Vannielia litorea]
MPWVALLLAGLLEVLWAYSMKKSQGFTLPGPSLVTLVTMIASFALLAWAMRSLPLGTAYAIWTGIGATGSFALGILVLGEPASPARLAAIGLIVGGIVLLRLAG